MHLCLTPAGCLCGERPVVACPLCGPLCEQHYRHDHCSVPGCEWATDAALLAAHGLSDVRCQEHGA